MDIQLEDHAAEFELVFQCSRIRLIPAGEDRIRTLVSNGIDWYFLIRTAQQHRVVPLLFNTLNRVCADLLPLAVVRDLRKRCEGNVQRNLFLTAELLRVLDLLEMHHVAAIPYKGPILATLLYKDCSLRQFSDIDVIVPVKDLEKATSLLVAHGYDCDEQLTREELLKLTHHEKHLILRRADITLELHWGVTAQPNPIDLSNDFLWGNLTHVSVAGRLVNTHAPEDLLLILCIHGGKHRWEHLVWLCDIAELIHSYPTLNWSLVLQNARQLRATRILLLGVTLAERLLGVVLPDEILRLIEADSVLLELTEDVMRSLTREHPADEPGEMARYFMHLREHRSDRFLVAWTQARHYLTVTERDREVLPQSSQIILQIVRPFRLVWEYGLAPFRRFCKGILQLWRG